MISNTNDDGCNSHNSIFSLKGQLATNSFDVRSIPSSGDYFDFASGIRVATMAAGSKSIRGSAGDHEKVPRNTKGPTGSSRSSIRTEAAATEEKSESAKIPDKEEFPSAIRHYGQLLLFSTILRNLRCYI